MPTGAALVLLSSAGPGRENIRKGSWFNIRAERDHSAVIVAGKSQS